MEIVVLHSVDDARDCIRRGLFQGRLIVTTHPAASVYLTEENGIDSHSVTSFLGVEDIQRLMQKSSAAVDEILKGLDARFSSALAGKIGVEMRFFTPLYGYLGKYHHSAYLVFAEALKRAREKNSAAKIWVYNRRLSSFFDVQSDMRTVAPKLLGPDAVEIISADQDGGRGGAAFRTLLRRLRGRSLVKFIRKLCGLTNSGLRATTLRSGRSTVLLHGDLCDLQFLPDRLGDLNRVFYNQSGGTPTGFRGERLDPPLKLPPSARPISDEPVDAQFEQDVLDDFGRGAASYGNSLATLAKIAGEHPISLGIWGSPPVSGAKALLFEFLSAKKVRIVGAQHGSVYGEMCKPWHFDSDFNRCDHFFSYGFTGTDLKRLYPARESRAKIIPVGTTRKIRPASRPKKTFDIVFPVTPIRSIFDGWHTNGPSHIFVDRQIKILRFLAELKDASVCIKLLADSDDLNCAVLPLLRTLPRLEIVENMSLVEFLERYRAKGAIIEAPSTPLHEMVPMDMEIFLMNDLVQPFEAEALRELEKRVYYCEDTDRLLPLLSSFLRGTLEKKRDNSFLNHYIRKPNTENEIAKYIQQWMTKA